jgi:glycosyltransferase involved in cell wall biosynthesis
VTSVPRILILIPVYADWEPLRLLIERLDEELSAHALRASLVLVDDASPAPPRELVRDRLNSIDEVRLVTLRRNVGHQRAIAVGLAWVHDHVPCDEVVVMDADGEDAPADVPRLVAKCADNEFGRIIFARRMKRSEGVRFAAFYLLFKALYRVMTGTDMRVGNFSVIPFPILQRVIAVSEIWSHYVSGLMKARLPYATIDTVRARRLAGRSQMNFVALVTHGLSAIAVNGDVFGVRMLIATSIMVFFAVAAMIAAIAIRFGTNLAIPGWTTYVVAFSLLTILQAIGLSFFFIFIILGGRSQLDMIPQRDYIYFVLNSSVVYGPS